jgi:hypothetical protein
MPYEEERVKYGKLGLNKVDVGKHNELKSIIEE